MSQNKTPIEPRNDKLELAKKIAEQSSKVFKTYKQCIFILNSFEFCFYLEIFLIKRKNLWRWTIFHLP